MWSCHDKHLLATVCSTAVMIFSKVTSSRKILSMWWILNLWNSSLQHIFNFILLESAKLNKIVNKLWRTFPDGWKDHITQSWNLLPCDHCFWIPEWNHWCMQWPEEKKKPFQHMSEISSALPLIALGWKWVALTSTYLLTVVTWPNLSRYSAVTSTCYKYM